MGLLAGTRAVPGALAFLRGHRELWPFCILPLLINLCVFALAVVVFLANLDAIVAALRATLEVGDAQAWYEWLWIGPLRVLTWTLRWLFVALFMFTVYFLFTVVGAVVAAPFLDVLSSRVERATTGAASGKGGALRAVVAEGQRALFFLGLQIGWIALGLIPGLQLLAAAGLFVSSALFLPLEYTSYLLDRRGISFARRRAWLWSHRGTMFGFGATAFASFLIPGLNFLALPLLVTAGTRLALEVGPPD